MNKNEQVKVLTDKELESVSGGRVVWAPAGAMLPAVQAKDVKKVALSVERIPTAKWADVVFK